MLESFKKYFSPPIFPEDEDKTRSAFYINAIVLVSLPVLFLFLLIRIALGNSMFAPDNLVLLGLILVLSIVWALTKKWGSAACGVYSH